VVGCVGSSCVVALRPNPPRCLPFFPLLLSRFWPPTDATSDRHTPKSLTCHLSYPYLPPLPPSPPTTTEIPVDAMLKHAKRITASTGKAAWISATAFLVLIVPLIIEMDREQQLIDLEAGQLDALTGGGANTA